MRGRSSSEEKVPCLHVPLSGSRRSQVQILSPRCVSSLLCNAMKAHAYTRGPFLYVDLHALGLLSQSCRPARGASKAGDASVPVRHFSVGVAWIQHPGTPSVPTAVRRVAPCQSCMSLLRAPKPRRTAAPSSPLATLEMTNAVASPRTARSGRQSSDPNDASARLPIRATSGRGEPLRSWTTSVCVTAHHVRAVILVGQGSAFVVHATARLS